MSLLKAVIDLHCVASLGNLFQLESVLLLILSLVVTTTHTLSELTLVLTIMCTSADIINCEISQLIFSHVLIILLGINWLY